MSRDRPGATLGATTRKENTIETIALVAHLKPEAGKRAAELLRGGPPFDPAELGMERHRVFLSATEVVFVFEGHQVEWMVDDLVSDPNAWTTHRALEAWRPLVDGPPRIARPAYTWDRD